MAMAEIRVLRLSLQHSVRSERLSSGGNIDRLRKMDLKHLILFVFLCTVGVNISEAIRKLSIKCFY